MHICYYALFSMSSIGMQQGACQYDSEPNTSALAIGTPMMQKCSSDWCKAYHTQHVDS